MAEPGVKARTVFLKNRERQFIKGFHREGGRMKEVLELDDLGFDPVCVSTVLWTFLSPLSVGTAVFTWSRQCSPDPIFWEQSIRSRIWGSQCHLWLRAGAEERFARSKFKETFYFKLVEVSASCLFFKHISTRLSGVYRETSIFVLALPAPNPGHRKL